MERLWTIDLSNGTRKIELTSKHFLSGFSEALFITLLDELFVDIPFWGLCSGRDNLRALNFHGIVFEPLVFQEVR